MRIQVLDTMKCMSIDYCTNGAFTPKVAQKRFGKKRQHITTAALLLAVPGKSSLRTKFPVLTLCNSFKSNRWAGTVLLYHQTTYSRIA
jgi:hypothetical protein